MSTGKPAGTERRVGGTVRGMLLVVVTCGLALAACGGTESATPSSTTTTSTLPDDGGDLDPGEVDEALFAAIVDDVLTRSGSPRSALTVVRAEEAIWNDGSLGCPQPGESYTQAVEPGYWVVFDVAGETFDYRATRRGFFKLCPPGSDARPPTG